MGNNDAFTMFESTVIVTYNAGILTLELLDIFGNLHRDTDIDEGGSRDLVTSDGLSVNEVILKTIDIEAFERLACILEGLGPNPDGHPDVDDLYYQPRFDAVHQITKSRWGWL